MPVRKGSPEAFIKRGGRIPAPLQALKTNFHGGGFMENMIKKSLMPTTKPKPWKGYS